MLAITLRVKKIIAAATHSLMNIKGDIDGKASKIYKTNCELIFYRVKTTATKILVIRSTQNI